MAKTKRQTEKDEIREWFNRIEYAKRVRRDADEKYGYTKATQMYQGDYRSAMPSFVTDVPIIPINEVYSFVKTFIPSVFSRNPHISVNAKGAKHIASSKIWELWTNAQWRELRLKKETRRVIVDACLAEGWMKMGYTATFGSIEPEDGKPKMDASEYVMDEEIFAKRVSWTNMLRDPDATDGLHDARWVAERIILPLDAARASTIWDHTETIKAAMVEKTGDEHLEADLRSRISDGARELAVLWYIEDRDSGRVLTISEGNNRYHMNKPWPYKFDGFSYELLRFNENPDEPYAPNLITPWVHQLWEKIKIRAMQLDHLKRFGRQLAAEEGSMTRSEMDKFKKGKTGSVVKYKKGSQPPVPIPYPQIQADVYGIESRIDLDKDNISGQPNVVRSAPQKTQSRTLGELDRLTTSFTARQSDPADRLDEFNSEIAFKLIAVAKQYMTGEQFVRATQKELQEIAQAFPGQIDSTGVTFTKEDIQKAEFEISIKSGSSLPSDREGKLQSLLQMVRFGPNIGIIPGSEVSLTVGKGIISEFDMKEVEVAYDKMINKIKAQEQVALEAARGRNDLQQERIQELKGQGGELNDL